MAQTKMEHTAPQYGVLLTLLTLTAGRRSNDNTGNGVGL
jgi:hypothetical protein